MKTIKLPKSMIGARMMPKTYNEESNTVDVVWTTGAAVKRFDWFSGEYYFEELAMAKSNVRMERLEAGAPVLNSHDQEGLNKVIGVVEKASLKGDEGIATLRLSSRSEVAGIVRDIKDGILRNISVGYKIHKVEEIKKKGDDLMTYRVVDWEPLEVSFVAVPADPKAQVRSEKDKMQSFDCEVITSNKGEVSMKKKENLEVRSEEVESNEEQEIVEEVERTEEAPSEEEVKEEEEVATEEVEAEAKEEDRGEDLVVAERSRVSEILTLKKKHNLSEDEATRFINDGKSISEVNETILAGLEKRDNETKTNNVMEIKVMENKQARKEAFVRGMLHRSNPSINKIQEGDNEFVLSPLEAARKYLALEIGAERVLGMSKSDLATRALHHTSDFADILKDSCNKSLMMGYNEANATYQEFVRNRSVSDFKDINSSRLVNGGLLEKVNEHGEYKRDTIDEDAEKYKLETYGKVIGATRRLLINDDLDAFTAIPQMLGSQVARTENRVFWDLFATPQVMSDGVALYHATHGNLSTVTGGITEATLKDFLLLARKQKEGDKYLNILLKTLVVSPEREVEALKFLKTITPDSVGNVNVFSESLNKVLVEPILSEYSTTAFYATGSQDQGPMAEKATLNGQGPEIFTRENWDIDGMEVKIRYDFGMRITDHRQFYKNEGN